MQIILKYFPDIDSQKKEKFANLFDLYYNWNNKINVISRKDIDKLYERHILFSLSIAKFIQFKPGTKIIDVGTGGGLPGIPLAIMFPDTNFILVDSINKKLKVVNEICKSLKITNIKTIHSRIEDLSLSYDFIISRAVTNFTDFVKNTKKLKQQKSTNKIKNGIIYLKGGDTSNEENKFKNKLTVINISDYFNEPFFETKKLIFYKNQK